MTLDPITQYRLLEMKSTTLPDDLYKALLKYGVKGTRHSKSISDREVNQAHNTIFKAVEKEAPYQYGRNPDEKKLQVASKQSSAFIRLHL